MVTVLTYTLCILKISIITTLPVFVTFLTLKLNQIIMWNWLDIYIPLMILPILLLLYLIMRRLWWKSWAKFYNDEGEL